MKWNKLQLHSVRLIKSVPLPEDPRYKKGFDVKKGLQLIFLPFGVYCSLCGLGVGARCAEGQPWDSPAEMSDARQSSIDFTVCIFQDECISAGLSISAFG